MKHLTVCVLAACVTAACGDTPLPTAPTGFVTQTTGRWTPVLGGSGGASGQVYKSQHGEWVLTGVQVSVFATITLSRKGTIIGDLEIQGLPFPSAPGHDSACVFGDYDDGGADQVWVAGIIGSSQSVVWLRHRDAPSRNMSPMTTADVSDITALEMSCTYMTEARR